MTEPRCALFLIADEFGNTVRNDMTTSANPGRGFIQTVFRIGGAGDFTVLGIKEAKFSVTHE